MKPINEKIVYLFGIVILVVLTVLRVSLIFAVLWLCAAAMVGCIFVYVSYTVMGPSKMAKINNILFEECDPEKFIREIEKIKLAYKNNPHENSIINFEKIKMFNKRKVLQDSLSYLIAIALRVCGKCDEALNILHSVDISKMSGVTAIMHHGFLMEIYVEKEDFENAAYEYENYIKDFEAKITNPEQIAAFKHSILLYQFLQNKTPETARHYLEQVESIEKNDTGKKSKLLKLSLMYDIAIAELEIGNTKDALEKFKTITEQGSMLWIAKLSQNKIDELNKSYL